MNKRKEARSLVLANALADTLPPAAGRTVQALEDAKALRRIAMTLHRWHEDECNGYIQRDEGTGQPYAHSQHTSNRWTVADREKGALKRLAAIMARYPSLDYYVQGDPRGAALYVLRPGDVPAGQDKGSYYNRGIAVHK